jgi:hypothetical protein
VTFSRTDSPPARRTVVATACALAVLVSLTYSAAPLGEFVWDDRVLIVEQERDLASTSFSELFLEPFFPASGAKSARNFYRPLVKASFVADLHVWGLSPTGFHLTNVALHLLNTVLLFLLLLRQAARPNIAVFLAAAFGLAPRLTEAVAWISGRTDVLAATFCLLALLVAASPRFSSTSWSRWASALLVLLGLFSKESALAGVVALAAREWLASRGESASFRLSRLVPVTMALTVYAGLRWTAMSAVQSTSMVMPLTPGERIATSIEAVGRYLTMIALPWFPATQIGIPSEPVWPLVILGGIGLATGLWAALRFPRAVPGCPPGWALFLVPLALVAFVPLPMNVVAADRFLYLPLAGLALLLPNVLAKTTRLPTALRTAAIPLVVLATFAAASYLRVPRWNSDISLWEPETRQPGATSYPFVQLAEALTRRGEAPAALPLLETAEAKSREFDRRHPLARSIRGVQVVQGLAFFALERYHDAETVFRELVEYHPGTPEFRENLAICLAMQFRLDEALAVLEAPRHVPAAQSTLKLSRRLREFATSHPRRDGASDPAQSRRVLLRLLSAN